MYVQVSRRYIEVIRPCHSHQCAPRCNPHHCHKEVCTKVCRIHTTTSITIVFLFSIPWANSAANIQRHHQLFRHQRSPRPACPTSIIEDTLKVFRGRYRLLYWATIQRQRRLHRDHQSSRQRVCRTCIITGSILSVSCITYLLDSVIGPPPHPQCLIHLLSGQFACPICIIEATLIVVRSRYRLPSAIIIHLQHPQCLTHRWYYHLACHISIITGSIPRVFHITFRLLHPAITSPQHYQRCRSYRCNQTRFPNAPCTWAICTHITSFVNKVSHTR